MFAPSLSSLESRLGKANSCTTLREEFDSYCPNTSHFPSESLDFQSSALAALHQERLQEVICDQREQEQALESTERRLLQNLKEHDRLIRELGDQIIAVNDQRSDESDEKGTATKKGKNELAILEARDKDLALCVRFSAVEKHIDEVQHIYDKLKNSEDSENNRFCELEEANNALRSQSTLMCRKWNSSKITYADKKSRIEELRNLLARELLEKESLLSVHSNFLKSVTKAEESTKLFFAGNSNNHGELQARSRQLKRSVDTIKAKFIDLHLIKSKALEKEMNLYESSDAADSVHNEESTRLANLATSEEPYTRSKTFNIDSLELQHAIRCPESMDSFLLLCHGQLYVNALEQRNAVILDIYRKIAQDVTRHLACGEDRARNDLQLKCYLLQCQTEKRIITESLQILQLDVSKLRERAINIDSELSALRVDNVELKLELRQAQNTLLKEQQSKVPVHCVSDRKGKRVCPIESASTAQDQRKRSEKPVTKSSRGYHLVQVAPLKDSKKTKNLQIHSTVSPKSGSKDMSLPTDSSDPTNSNTRPGDIDVSRVELSGKDPCSSVESVSNIHFGSKEIHTTAKRSRRILTLTPMNENEDIWTSWNRDVSGTSKLTSSD